MFIFYIQKEMKKHLFFFVALCCYYSSNAKVVNPSKVDTLKTYSLQDVQVLSIRANSKMPIAFKNLSQKDLKAINYGKDLPFLLSLTPSVVTTSDAGNGIGYTSIFVRGTDPSRINITSNGIPVNDAESSQVFWVNMGDFASSIGSLQIQRGVGTSTNGSSAFGATINMETEKIGTKPFLGLDVSGGSYSTHKETLRFGTGLLGGHWGIQGRLSNIGSAGYLDRASIRLNSYFVQGGYFSDNTVVKFVTFNGTERTYHAWNYASKYEQSINGRRYNKSGEMGKDANGVMRYYDDQTDNYHQQHYQLFWNQFLSKEFSLNVALHYTNGKGYYEEFKDNKKLFEYKLVPNGSTSRSNLVRQKWLSNNFYGAIASLNYDNKKNLIATLGGGWNKYDGDHYGLVKWVEKPVDNFLPNHIYYDNNTKKTDFNVYAKASYEFMKGLNAFVDLQYRHVGIRMFGPSDVINQTTGALFYNLKDHFNFLNPKFGVNYDINKNNRVYVSYAISHREPVRNNYEHDLNAGRQTPVAERLNDLELGYKYSSEKFTAGANIYYMNYKNQFVLTGEVDALGEAITRNFEKSYRTGIELEWAYQPINWFRWDANATFSQNKVRNVSLNLTDGSVETLQGKTNLAFSPSVIFNNIFTFNYKGFNARVINRYVGEQYLTNTGFKTMQTKNADGSDAFDTLMLKDYFTTDLDLSYNFGLKKIGIKDATIGITIYNLFSAKFDSNGFAAPQYTKKDGKVVAENTWGTRDSGWAAGFAPSAPINVMAHLSVNF